MILVPIYLRRTDEWRGRPFRLTELNPDPLCRIAESVARGSSDTATRTRVSVFFLSSPGRDDVSRRDDWQRRQYRSG